MRRLIRKLARLGYGLITLPGKVEALRGDVELVREDIYIIRRLAERMVRDPDSLRDPSPPQPQQTVFLLGYVMHDAFGVENAYSVNCVAMTREAAEKLVAHPQLGVRIIAEVAVGTSRRGPSSEG